MSKPCPNPFERALNPLYSHRGHSTLKSGFLSLARRSTPHTGQEAYRTPSFGSPLVEAFSIGSTLITLARTMSRFLMPSPADGMKRSTISET